MTLTRVKSPDDAEQWTRLLLAWEAEYLPLTKARTYRKHALEVPSWARPGATWWYTHQRLRSGHQVLRRVIRQGHLFTFLDPKLEPLNVPSVQTNGIEGGTNSQMRLLLLHHRGDHRSTSAPRDRVVVVLALRASRPCTSACGAPDASREGATASTHRTRRPSALRHRTRRQ